MSFFKKNSPELFEQVQLQMLKLESDEENCAVTSLFFFGQLHVWRIDQMEPLKGELYPETKLCELSVPGNCVLLPLIFVATLPYLDRVITLVPPWVFCLTSLPQRLTGQSRRVAALSEVRRKTTLTWRTCVKKKEPEQKKNEVSMRMLCPPPTPCARMYKYTRWTYFLGLTCALTFFFILKG